MEKVQEKRILVVAKKASQQQGIQKTLCDAGYRTYAAGEGGEAIELIYSEPPDLILIERDLPGVSGDQVCSDLKQENIFGHLPILMILQAEDLRYKNLWEDVPVDDFLIQPIMPDELLSRVSLAFYRISRTLDANPLTRLPGNNTIIQEVQSHLDSGEKFALSYADLDHFKAFNDKYGFSRGDEVLRMTARVITNAVRQSSSKLSFVGHVGGDDFIFLLPLEEVDSVCQEILNNFDLIVTTFYDEDDRMRRSIETVDRRGKRATFPIMSLSIAVAHNEKRTFTHFGEMSAITAEIKKHVKGMKGSNYFKDRRTD
jgi:diguanylate cyclase (GGDEF)-like protein